jgi:hypothetical protein
MSKDLVYLALPFSHADKKIRNYRFHAANKMAGKLMKEGFNVFSPISHTAVIAADYDLPHTWAFWSEQDLSILKHCQKLVVLMLEGWKNSVGVMAEIAFAQKMNIPIEYINE